METPVATKINWNEKVNKENCINFNNDGKTVEFVLLKELLRLADQRGVKSRKVVFLPHNLPAPSAACTVEITWSDGEVSCGSGDCSPDNSDPGFGSYPHSMAESRAMARAIRFGLNISMCSWEEVSSKTMTGATKDSKAPITDGQKKVIEAMIKRQKADLDALLKQGTRKVDSIDQLTVTEASNLIQYLNTK